jgi:hypothetical protein
MTDVEIIRPDAWPPSNIARELVGADHGRGFDGVTARAAAQPT